MIAKRAGFFPDMWWLAAVGLVSALIFGVSSGSLTGAGSLPLTHAEQAVADGQTGSQFIRGLGNQTVAGAEPGSLHETTGIAVSEPAPPSVEAKPAADPVTFRVTASRVNLRTFPDAHSSSVARLGRGTEVEVIESSGDWVRVRLLATGRSGWMSSAFLREISTSSSRNTGSAG